MPLPENMSANLERELTNWKESISLPDDPFLPEPVGGIGVPFASVEVR